MKIVNLSKKTIISENVKEGKNFSDKILGLLRKSNPGSLMFKTRFGIHTFFLKVPIDVIVMDQNFEVVKLTNVKPNKLFFYNPKYFYVLELPKGSIKKSKTQTGDILRLQTGLDVE